MQGKKDFKLGGTCEYKCVGLGGGVTWGREGVAGRHSDTLCDN
jgi:hypothetical protein